MGIEFRGEDAGSGVRNAVGVLVILPARQPVSTHAIANEHLVEHKTALVPESRYLPGSCGVVLQLHFEQFEMVLCLRGGGVRGGAAGGDMQVCTVRPSLEPVGGASAAVRRTGA